MHSYWQQDKIKAFLPRTQDDTSELQQQLAKVLSYANIEVLHEPDSLQDADCSIHLLGNDYNAGNFSDKYSDTEYWFKTTLNRHSGNTQFRIFIWQPPTFFSGENQPQQEIFVNSIRNSLFQNMTFSNQASPVMLVEDIRSVIFSEQKPAFNIMPTDVFFIYNETDEEFSESIADLLDDVVKVEKLKISLNTRTDYSEMVAQQMQKSLLTVVYFNRTANWALPFVQQIWKKTGGVSANKTILMAGDAELEPNRHVSFDVANVESVVAATELIPLEIKVFFDRIVNKENPQA